MNKKKNKYKHFSQLITYNLQRVSGAKLCLQLVSGFSIVEMLISTALLAVLMIIATQSLASSLKNSKKSDSISKVRENVDYAISTMERLLRNAQDATCTSTTRLDYTDEYGNSVYLRCLSPGSYGYIASGSATTILTSTSVNLDCTTPVFVCPTPAAGVPQTVEISIKATENPSVGAEGSTITSKTRIQLRNYTSF